MKPDEYLDQYFKWLKDNTIAAQVGQYCEITTPFLDRKNDCIQFYVKYENGQLFFTDDGYTMANLEMDGMNITAAREQQISDILNQYGARLDHMEITAECPEKDLAFKKNMFLQAILHVSDMYMLNQQRVASVFSDDIKAYFDSHKIYYTPSVFLAGKTGFNHRYDFVLQRSERKPERLCVSMNTVDRTSLGKILFGWLDTQSARGKDTRLIVFINDYKTPSSSVISAFQNYDAIPILWSHREDTNNIDLLTA